MLIARPDESGSFSAEGKRRVKMPIDLDSVLRVIRGPKAELSLAEVKGHLAVNAWSVEVCESSVGF